MINPDGGWLGLVGWWVFDTGSLEERSREITGMNALIDLVICIDISTCISILISISIPTTKQSNSTLIPLTSTYQQAFTLDHINRHPSLPHGCMSRVSFASDKVDP